MPGACPYVSISETTKYSFINFLIMDISIRGLLEHNSNSYQCNITCTYGIHTSLFLMDSPSFMGFKELCPVRPQRFGS